MVIYEFVLRNHDQLHNRATKDVVQRPCHSNKCLAKKFDSHVIAMSYHQNLSLASLDFFTFHIRLVIMFTVPTKLDLILVNIFVILGRLCYICALSFKKHFFTHDWSFSDCAKIFNWFCILIHYLFRINYDKYNVYVT